MKLPVMAQPGSREMLDVLLGEQLNGEALHMEGPAGWRTLMYLLLLPEKRSPELWGGPGADQPTGQEPTDGQGLSVSSGSSRRHGDVPAVAEL